VQALFGALFCAIYNREFSQNLKGIFIMKKLVTSAKVAAFSAVGTALAVVPAFAADELGAITVDTSNFVTAAVALVGALVTFWGIKKALSLIGR